MSGERVSAVLLNWDTPHLLRHISIPTLEAMEDIDQVIVSHGREEHFFPFESDSLEVVNLQHWGEVAQRYNMARRWVGALEARNDVVLHLDNDLMVNPSALRRMLSGYKEAPQAIHGICQRCVTPRGEYAQFPGTRQNWDGPASIVMAGMSMHHRSLAEECLKQGARVEAFMKESTPVWNGEDFWACMVALWKSGDWNRAYAIPWREFRAHNRGRIAQDEVAHFTWRSTCLRRFSEELGLEERLRLDPACAALGAVPIAGGRSRIAKARFRFMHWRRRVKARARAWVGGRLARTFVVSPRTNASDAYPSLPPSPVSDRLATGVTHFLKGVPWRMLLRRNDGLCGGGAFFHPGAPSQLLHNFPSAKVLLVLPHPGLWAQTDAGTKAEPGAWLRQRLEREKAFAKAIPPLLQRIAQMYDGVFPNRPPRSLPPPVLSRGGYGPWLEFWLAGVPRDQLLVVPEEALGAGDSTVPGAVRDFLGTEIPAPPRRKRPLVAPLAAHFRDAWRETRDLLDRYGHPPQDWQRHWGADDNVAGNEEHGA